MQKFLDFNKRSRRIVKYIKEDLSYLIEMNREKDEELKVLKKSVPKIKKELDKIEGLFEEPDKSQDSETIDILDEINEEKHKRETDHIRKNIKVKRSRRSKSFGAWAFNNNEL